MAPTSVSSRLSARPMTPLPKSSISFNIAPVRPSIFATPSPISRTMPTFWRPTAVFTPEIWASISCNILLINRSVGVQLKGFTQSFEARAHTSIVHITAHLDAQATQQRGVFGKTQIQASAVFAGQVIAQGGLLFGGQRGGTLHLGRP